MDARTRAVTSIEQAREDLDRALAELDQIPAFDPHIVGSVAHTLNNYASVMSATTAMLRNALPHPEPEVATWLGAIDHATVLMHHTIGRLLHVSAPPDFPLKPEFVNVPLLMERAVHYHQPTAEMKGIGIAIRTIGEVPPAWADRVAVAVIVDNLLAYTIARSNRRATIRIEISAEPDQVICSLRFGGGLTIAEQERAFHGDHASWIAAGSAGARRCRTRRRLGIRRFDGRIRMVSRALPTIRTTASSFVCRQNRDAARPSQRVVNTL